MTVPPIAKRQLHQRLHHGDVFDDYYEWLRDSDDPEVLGYLEAENEYSETQTAHLADLRAKIFDEIKARTQETDMSVPVRNGSWWYYTRTVEGEQYTIRCRSRVIDTDDWNPPNVADAAESPDEQVLLDSNADADGHDYYGLGAFSVSDEGNLLAWSVDTTGDERYTVRFKDLSSGELLDDTVTGAAAGVTWSADSSHVFYTKVDDAWRPFQVWRHRLGTPNSDDVLVFEEPDERYFIGVGRTHSRKYLLLYIGSKITSEYRYLPAIEPEGEFDVVLPRREGVEYSLEHAVIAGEDRFLILHNDGAQNFELTQAPVAAPQNQSIVIAGSAELRLEDIDVFANHVVVSYRRDALTRIGLLPIDENDIGSLREIDFDKTLFTCGVGANPAWSAPLLRVGVTSFIDPAAVYDYDLETGKLILRKQMTVLGDYDPTQYQQQRVWAGAADGVEVPLSVISRIDTPVDGSAPALIYGYGSYEASIDPAFSIARLSLLDRGFVFAVAHVRGGGELGRHWYDDGKTLTKRNTFTDFVACAETLIKDSWTSADRLVAEGGSAGGLLMGAVANIAPQLFAGVLASVPFVDALTSILKPELPLTVIEWDEWGNPLEDPDVYAYMKSYSPYENISPQQYPRILAVTSLHDTRVLYVEPAKWVAKLRAESQSDQQVLLKTEMSAGHGGVSGRYAAWHERAWELAWIIDVTGKI